MNDDAPRRRILGAWAALPAEAREPAASEAELARFEVAFGGIPEEYRWFLRNCGGGTAGGQRLDGIRDLAKSQTRLQKEAGPPMGWSLERAFVIAWNAAGPVAIHKPTGRVVVEERGDGVRVAADSFRLPDDAARPAKLIVRREWPASPRWCSIESSA